MPQRFLVTGGAGYVGSHLVAALLDRGDRVTVLDNLRTGHKAAVPSAAPLVIADLAAGDTLDALLADGPWDAVFHFASLSQVGDSMRMPMRYLLENATNGIRLIDACVRHRVERFVLSSTAALFNLNSDAPITEDAPVDPQSAYGDSKWMIERALRWAGQVHGLRYACLRYFNAAGADPAGVWRGPSARSHLCPAGHRRRAGPAQRARRVRRRLPDGGWHLHTRLRACFGPGIGPSAGAGGPGQGPRSLELGKWDWSLGPPGDCRGRARVRVESAVSSSQPARGRRRGPVASSSRAQRAGWCPEHDDLDDIVGSAFAWRKSHPNGYGD